MTLPFQEVSVSKKIFFKFCLCESIQKSSFCNRSRSTQGYHFFQTLLDMLAMLHTKSQRYWPFGSGEEVFWSFLPYRRMAAILFKWYRGGEQTLLQPFAAPYEIWLWLAKWFLRRKRLNSVDGQTTTAGRRTEPAYTISSPQSLKVQVR